MLKKRIIPIQLLKGSRLCKSKQFSSFRDVGDPIKSSEVYNSQYADELIFLNIDREVSGIDTLLEVLKGVSQVCFMPLAVGGGIRRYEDAAKLIESGADKVVLNSICYDDLDLIARVAHRFGRQAIVVAVDVARVDGQYVLFSHCGKNRQPISLDAHLGQVEHAGAGELLAQSIDADGMMAGFDLELIKRVAERISVPVIACGGSGNYVHLKDVFLETKVSAVACGSIFNFTDSNLVRAKAYLSNYGLPFKVV